MAKFTYLVTIEVSDDDLVPSDDNIREFYCEEAEDEDGSFSPATLARIVMQERMGCDEDYGFDYTVDCEDYGTFLLKLTEAWGCAMTARIIHNEEGYTAQCDCPQGDSFPPRRTESDARDDLFNHEVQLWGVDSATLTQWDKDLEVIES